MHEKDFECSVVAFMIAMIAHSVALFYLSAVCFCQPVFRLLYVSLLEMQNNCNCAPNTLVLRIQIRLMSLICLEIILLPTKGVQL